MQNQESMFGKPEPTPVQPINTDPRERRQRQEAPPAGGDEEGYKDYSEGYGNKEHQEGYTEPPYEGASWQTEGEKLRPRQRPGGRKRSRAKPLLIALLIIALLIGAAGVASGRMAGPVGSQSAQTFVVTSAPTLVINNGSGNVRIHTGNVDNVVVEARERGFGFSNDKSVPVKTEKNGNTITVSPSNTSNDFFGNGRVDLDVTVPTASNLDIQTTSGNIDLEDVNGQVSLATGSGDIEGNRISGTVSVKTGSGEVKLEQAQLQGTGSIRSGSGDIRVQGALDSQANYQFQTGSGDVNLKLPRDSSFHLAYSTGSGDYNNEFERRSEGSNGSSNASITIRTGSGDINIQPQDD